jgi:hypothetical protein
LTAVLFGFFLINPSTAMGVRKSHPILSRYPLSCSIQIITGIYGFLVGKVVKVSPPESQPHEYPKAFWGAAIVIFLARIVNFHNEDLQGFWVEVSSQVVNGTSEESL